MNSIESQKGEIVMYQPDETIRLEVRVEDETVWLTQAQMAELFQTTRNNITLHIGNIFKEDLDVIISVGSSEHDKIKTPFVADSPIMQVKRQKNTKTFGRLKLKHYLCNRKKVDCNFCELS